VKVCLPYSDNIYNPIPTETSFAIDNARLMDCCIKMNKVVLRILGIGSFIRCDGMICESGIPWSMEIAFL
jgi:hypothetical protein